MQITRNNWLRYVKALAKIDDTAGDLVTEYLATHNILNDEEMRGLLDFVYGVVTKYGEASAELACLMYDATAAAQGASVPPAEPAPTATYPETARAVNGTLLDSERGAKIAGATKRLVKQAGVDTTMQNALRDGAEFAWVPYGDTCAFCLMLGSNGWQHASKKAVKNGHASHVHANCDCTYAVRFDSSSGVSGYDPDALRETYDNAEGSNWREKMNSMRRDLYEKNPEKYREQKRKLYAKNVAQANTTKANVTNLIKGNTADRTNLAKSILADYNVTGVKENIVPMTDRGYCEIVDNNGILEVLSYNLQDNDNRSAEYQIKTAFHEAYHASCNGYPTDVSKMNTSKWLDLEETFAECSAHYMASQYGLKDLAPAYADKLVKMLPRLKQLPEFSGCKTIADFGKVAQNARQAGGGSVWKQLSARAMRKKYLYSDYVKQYFGEIRKDIPGYVDKYLENAPSSRSFRNGLISDLTNAMNNIDKYGFTLTSSEGKIIENAVAIAMNRVGVF